MRMYQPKQPIMDGSYLLPAITRVGFKAKVNLQQTGAGGIMNLAINQVNILMNENIQPDTAHQA